MLLRKLRTIKPSYNCKPSTVCSYKCVWCDLVLMTFSTINKISTMFKFLDMFSATSVWSQSDNDRVLVTHWCVNSGKILKQQCAYHTKGVLNLIIHNKCSTGVHFDRLHMRLLQVLVDLSIADISWHVSTGVRMVSSCQCLLHAWKAQENISLVRIAINIGNFQFQWYVGLGNGNI